MRRTVEGELGQLRREPPTTPGKFIISASPSILRRRISDSRSPASSGRRGDSNGDAGTQDGAMKKTSSCSPADASISQCTPSTPSTLAISCGSRDDGGRAEREHEPGELVNE